jgi:hypothetical protein
MNETVVTTMMITGFGIAFFHAATHWLPTSFKFIIRLCNSKRRTMNAVWCRGEGLINELSRLRRIPRDERRTS